MRRYSQVTVWLPGGLSGVGRVDSRNAPRAVSAAWREMRTAGVPLRERMAFRDDVFRVAREGKSLEEVLWKWVAVVVRRVPAREKEDAFTWRKLPPREEWLPTAVCSVCGFLGYEKDVLLHCRKEWHDWYRVTEDPTDPPREGIAVNAAWKRAGRRFGKGRGR